MRRALVVDAAQQAADDGGAGARDARDQRGALPASDDQRVQRGEAGQRAVGVGAQPLAEQQQRGVDDQERCRDGGRTEQAAEEVFQHEADDHRGDRGDDDQPEDATRFGDLVSIGQAEDADRQRPPVVPEIAEQRRGGAEMQHHQEGQERRRVLVQVPVQQRGQHDGVAEAADREQLGGALHDGDDDGLQRVHGGFLNETPSRGNRVARL